MNSTTTPTFEQTYSADADILLLVDKDVACLPLGFSFDAGGSILKLVYRSKKDYHKGQLKDQDSDYGKLRMHNMRNDDVTGLIEFLQLNCDMSDECWSGSEEARVWYHTGCCGQQLIVPLSKRLQISARILGEADLQGMAIRGFFSKGSSSGVHQCLHPISAQSADRARKMTLATANTMDCLKYMGEKSFSAMTNRPVAGTDLAAYRRKLMMIGPNELAAEMSLHDVIYPCILVVIGSSITLCLLGEDGSSVALDILSLSAKTFVNIGLKLTGAKDYHELVEMIRCGNSNNVNTMISDTKNRMETAVRDWYNVWADEILIFAFGKLGDARFSDTYSNEDIAAAWAASFCLNTAKIVSLYCTVHKVQSVLVGGSFVSHPILRDCLEECFMINSLLLPFTGGCNFRMTSLPNPGFLGALGAWIYNYEQKNSDKMTDKMA